MNTEKLFLLHRDWGDCPSPIISAESWVRSTGTDTSDEEFKIAAPNSRVICFSSFLDSTKFRMRYMKMHHFNRAALCGLMFFCAVRFACGESYYAQDLGTLGGSTSQAFALNNSGQVVGLSNITGNTYSHAVLFSGSGSNNIDLDIVGVNPTVGEARGINDSGQIIGWAEPKSGGRNEAMLYALSSKTNLGDLCDSSPTASEAQAINNSGTIIGYADDCDFTVQAARFSGKGTNNISLGGIGGGLNGVAYAINASGQIVGYGTREQDQLRHAALFNASGNVDLGTLAGTADSLAYGINDAGQIVGTCSVSNGSAFHATLFSGNGTNNIDLGTLGGMNSHAYAINNHGEIVGNSYPATNNNSVYHAFIYKNGVMSDINGLVLTNSGFSNIRFADGSGQLPGRVINDSGQIAAIGEVGGRTHAVLLTPVLRRLAVGHNGNDIVVNFDAVNGKTYRLLQTLDLTDPNWQSVPGVADFTATNTGPAQFIVTNGATFGKAYYRVQLL
jgi:probable HAF family extracellular repeat protein